jgi:hypothetical protein
MHGSEFILVDLMRVQVVKNDPQKNKNVLFGRAGCSLRGGLGINVNNFLFNCKIFPTFRHPDWNPDPL